MANRKDIMAPRPKKDGGTYWVKIGTAWEGEKGIQLVFDALPLPDKEGRVVASLFEPRQQDGGSRPTQQQARPAARTDFDDDLDSVPF